MTVAPERTVQTAAEAGQGRRRERDAERPTRLIDVADMVSRTLPDHRVEILGGQLVVSPPADGPHGEALTDLMAPLLAAELHRGQTRVIQGIGLWLPTGDDDHAVPDLAIVDDDYREHLVAYGCYQPAVFRMVVEITSTNWRDDLERKTAAYASAGVPVYVVGDRRHREVVVLTAPKDGEYRTRTVHRPGESFVLPESIGAKVEVETDALLRE